MARREFSWGYDDKTAEAPYYLIFTCYTYPRTSRGRVALTDPITRIILPGLAVNTGTAHRYSEDVPMMENLQQALGTIEGYDATNPANALPEDASLTDVLNTLDNRMINVSKDYQENAFGQLTSKLGRLDLLTTESGYLGSSKRKYAFNWNLKATSESANTFAAREIGEEFEMLSMPVVGGFASEGNIAQASRMRPPNVWTITAVNEFGSNQAETTNLWLGTPKICVLTSVLKSVDNQSFIAGEGGPFSYFLTCNFIELENVFNYEGSITSRSEFYNAIGDSQGGG
tara:strand:+ start:441 stop:1298 length:858 start_codon:yes stop_codon:yes gene_type:complete